MLDHNQTKFAEAWFENQIINKALDDADQQWEAARLKSLALERAVSPPTPKPKTRELSQPLRYGATVVLTGTAGYFVFLILSSLV